MLENQNIEYKKEWKDEYLEWVCCFANGQGGKLYIGVDDSGNVIGLPNANELMETIPNKILNTMSIVADVNLLEEDGKQYIEIIISNYPMGISYKGNYYIRSGSTRQLLKGTALESFLLKRRGAAWDNLPFPAFTMEDVNENAVNHFRKKARKKGRISSTLLDEPTDVLLDKLHLINNGYLTNAAILLFSNNPDKYQLGSYIKIGYFETDADLMYQDEVHGSLIEQIDKAIELIYFKYMKAKITYKGVQRQERYFVPEDALREALLNAICHKQYQSGIPIQVSVYEDKLYIANIGSLPENWTVNNLLNKHASKPYNPNIAHVFYLAGFIESWGRGIEKIRKALKEEELPMPEFTINSTDIMVKFVGTEDRIIRVTDKVTDRVTDKVTDNEMNLLQLIREDPGYNMFMLAELLGISRKTVAKYIKNLKDKDIIERVGSDRKGFWKIKEKR